MVRRVQIGVMAAQHAAPVHALTPQNLGGDMSGVQAVVLADGQGGLILHG